MSADSAVVRASVHHGSAVAALVEARLAPADQGEGGISRLSPTLAIVDQAQ